MPAPITSLAIASSSINTGISETSSAVSSGCNSISSAASSCYNPSLLYAAAGNAAVSTTTSSTTEFDQYLNAFFTQNSAVSQSAYPSSSSAPNIEPSCGTASASQFGSSFVSPSHTSSFLGQLNTSPFLSSSTSSNLDTLNGRSNSLGGSGMPSSLSSFNPTSFLHPRAGESKLSAFNSPASSGIESDHPNHHPAISTPFQYPFIEHSFASPSSLYYPLRSTTTNYKRPLSLNSIYGTGPNLSVDQSKCFATSISESLDFVSTDSPTTDTFSSPHSSPPQLVAPPPLATKSTPSSSSASLNRSNSKLFVANNLSCSSSVSMSASPTLPGQYVPISDAVTSGGSYSFDDYSALPFSAASWSPIITNLDTAAVMAAAVSQSPTLHHHSNLSQLQAAMVPSQQTKWQVSNIQSTSVGPSLGASVHNTGAMSLKDIKLYNNYPNKSKITNAELRIVKQPSTHHRARCMTEGSRGTIKDRTGRGYPVIQLISYNKSAVKLQCFIGYDQKIGDPHLFYQACEVSGKTPYTFVKLDGVDAIELDLLPKNNMQAVSDCMGILKERNVDVERKVLRNRRKSSWAHRAGGNATEEAKMIRNTNKSLTTHCRMVFRCILPDTGEIVQAVSDPVLCTQPLGWPEINKMSLRECHLKVGLELFIIGKNFHKHSKVIFECQAAHWRKVIVPQKQYLNSTHLVCSVPCYDGLNAQCLPLVNVHVSVHCNHKNSHPMKFIYTNGFCPTNAFESLGSMNWQAAAAYASVCTLRETTTVLASPIGAGSNANALFLLERNHVLK